METVEEMCHEEKVEFLKVRDESGKKAMKPWDEIPGLASGGGGLAYPLSWSAELTICGSWWEAVP
jgi:hypothetical protein